MSVQNETMQHLIAFNGFRGGNKGSASCQPLSEYDKTISQPWLHEMVLQIRGEKSIRSVDRTDETKIAKAQQRIKGRYFSKVLTDGPISRINFCTIPERLIGEDIPIYGNYDDEFRAQLKPYIENLCKASGLVDCPEAFNLAMKLKDENAEFSRLSQNRIYENFTFRGNVIGYLKACVLYVANGFRWEPEIEEFIRWSEQYDLYCKMRFFENGIKTASTSADGTKNMLYAWAHRGYIERRKAENKGGASGGTSGGTPDSSYSSYSSDCFIKLKFRKDGVVIES